MARRRLMFFSQRGTRQEKWFFGQTGEFWLSVLSAGHASCVQSCGLGAQTFCGAEVCYPLYGNNFE